MMNREDLRIKLRVKLLLAGVSNPEVAIDVVMDALDEKPPIPADSEMERETKKFGLYVNRVLNGRVK